MTEDGAAVVAAEAEAVVPAGTESTTTVRPGCSWGSPARSLARWPAALTPVARLMAAKVWPHCTGYQYPQLTDCGAGAAGAAKAAGARTSDNTTTSGTIHFN